MSLQLKRARKKINSSLTLMQRDRGIRVNRVTVENPRQMPERGRKFYRELLDG
jgi:hypothetical protein